MDFGKKGFNILYDISQKNVFTLTKKDPELAHEMLSLFCRGLYFSGLDKTLRTHKNKPSKIIISNAAGFNKNCEIPPRVLEYFGLDRIVIGSVTGKPWSGSKRPRIIRDTKNKTLVNWVGLDNKGAEEVSKRLEKYYSSGLEIPVTISLATTPNKNFGKTQKLEDIAKTINCFNRFGFVDRFEYNNSCPNINQRTDLKELEEILMSLREMSDKEIYLKVSPDMNRKETEKVINSSFDFVKGYVLTNTTTIHDYGKGGASGELLYKPSLETQKYFYEILKNSNKKIISCGGIDSKEKVHERIKYGASEIQIFTPLVFEGMKLTEKLRF